MVSRLASGLTGLLSHFSLSDPLLHWLGFCCIAQQHRTGQSALPMKMMAGWFSCATLNSILTSFSPSPCHLLVRVAAEMLKKVALASLDRAFASMVLPLPGGPYRSSPRAGALRPWNRSARCDGKITISCSACRCKFLKELFTFPIYSQDMQHR